VWKLRLHHGPQVAALLRRTAVGRVLAREISEGLSGPGTRRKRLRLLPRRVPVLTERNQDMPGPAAFVLPVAFCGLLVIFPESLLIDLDALAQLATIDQQVTHVHCFGRHELGG